MTPDRSVPLARTARQARLSQRRAMWVTTVQHLASRPLHSDALVATSAFLVQAHRHPPTASLETCALLGHTVLQAALHQSHVRLARMEPRQDCALLVTARHALPGCTARVWG